MYTKKFNKLALLVVVFLFVLGQPGLLLAAEETVSQEAITTEAASNSESTTVKENTEVALEPENEELTEVADTQELQPEGAQALMSFGEQGVGDIESPGFSQLRLSTDETSGALLYQFPLIIPPGRNNMQPDLAINYHSHRGDHSSVFGYGWTLNIPFIERLNKYGVDKLYDDDLYFYSSLSGELATTTTAGEFQAKVNNGNFLKYEFYHNTWTVTDKLGTVYTFGASTSTRQYYSTSTFKWLLEEVRDTNDNYISYEYYHDSNQVYPSKITYTGHGTTDGIYTVEFIRESRTDDATRYDTGFAVTTSYRIDEIQIKVNGTWIRKYALGFGTGDNGYSSILTSITESGQDELTNTLTLPSNNFSYNIKDTSWEEQTGYTIPEVFTNGNGVDFGLRLADLNGDGLIDLIRSHDDTTNYKDVYINNGDETGWTEDTNYTIPEYFVEGGNGTSLGVRLADVNGDGFVDILRKDTSASVNKVYINDKDGTGWTEDTNYTIPEDFKDAGIVLIDINGDGLVDILRSDSGESIKKVYINDGDGTGWTEDTNYSIPEYIINGGEDAGVRFADVNGDGLVDLLREHFNGSTVDKTYINKGDGTGWVYDSNYSIPEHFSENGDDIGVRLYDINGDGLVDIIRSSYINSTATKKVYINKGDGTGWAQDTGYSIPEYIVESNKDVGTRIVDVNGDGLVDFLRSMDTGHDIYKEVYHGKPNPADLLKEVEESSSLAFDVQYKSVPTYRDGSGDVLNTNMPQMFFTVYTNTVDDGLGNYATTTYEYAGGYYYFESPYEKQFGGFEEVITTDPNGNITKTFYHQGNDTATSTGEYSDDRSKIGKVYRVEKYDDSDNLYEKSIYKWENYDLGSDADFVKKTQEVSFLYDGDADHKDTAITYSYDNTNGNLTSQVTYGEVTGLDNGTYTDTGTDKFTTTIAYAASSTPYILGLPKTETLEDQSSNKVAETKYYYDNLSHGNVDKGNETKQERWVESTTYIDTEKTYNNYGLVTQEKDPRDKATNYTYDQYDLFVATSTNPLSQTQEFYYDYSLGQPKKVINANGHSFTTSFDALDRVKEQKQPNTDTPSTLETVTTYTYTDGTNPRVIEQTNYRNGTDTTTQYTYLDGFDRPVQTRSQVEAANTYAAQDYTYTKKGQVKSESLPYFSTGTSRTTATTTADMLTSYTYDALERIKTVVNAVGTTSYAYDQWETAITDTESNTKDLHHDAYQNLIKVEEHEGVSTYTTNYEWNGLQNLTKITDAASNVRNFTYDGLGRLKTAQDSHASADSYYGTWTYGYDNSSNLTSKLDPKSQTINYTYDDINRVLTENYTGEAGTEVAYGYDWCQYGEGLLCSATSTAAVVNFMYDPMSRVTEEVKTIDGSSYDTGYNYDRLGNITQLDYPDGSSVKYTYNNTGLAETIQWRSDSGSAWSNVVEDFDYSPLGQITYQDNANGTATTNTYDKDELYRLKHKVTSLSGMEMAMASLSTAMTPALAPSVSIANHSPVSTQDDELIFLVPQSQVSVLDGYSQNNYFVSRFSYDGRLLALKNPIDDTIQVSVGNVSKLGLAPELTIKKWNGDAKLTIEPVAFKSDSEGYQVQFNSDKLEFNDNDSSYRFYEIEGTDQYPDGAFELDVVLSTKPKTNVFEFNISTHDLDFYYQPALDVQYAESSEFERCTETRCYKEGKVVEYRPENVVGSYAVYSSEYSGDYSKLNGKNYKSGKVLHIYRPKIKDSGGDWTWGELSIDESRNKLSVTVPEKFLEQAAYPVIVDPTFGYDTIGSSWGYAGDKIVGSKFAGASGTAESITVYGDLTVGGVNFKYGLYDATSGYDFEEQTAEASSISDEWLTLNLDSNVNITDTDYIVAIWGSETTDSISPKYDTGATNQGLYKYKTYTTNYPDPLSSPSLDNKKYSVYVTYSTSTVGNGNNVSSIQDISYDYDNVGNITQIVDTSDTQTYKTLDFGYDDLYRLTSASSTLATSTSPGDYSRTYTYNALGNITNKSDIGNYLYQGDQGTSKANPHAATSINGQTITYDDNGNMTSDGTQSFVWDYDNRLVEVGTLSASTSTDELFVYDDSLASGWEDWSWSSTVTYDSSEEVYDGNDSIKVVYNAAWAGLYMHTDDGVNIDDMERLRLAIHGGSTAGQEPEVRLYDDDDQPLGYIEVSDYTDGALDADTWYELDIPITEFNVGTSTIGGMTVVSDIASTMYVDKVRFAVDTPGVVTSTVASYGYDHAGQRALLVSNTATTTYVNQYYNTDGITKTKHIYAGPALIATVEYTDSTSTLYYIHTDHLGGSSVMTDSSGTIVGEHDYYPFGDLRINEQYTDFDEQRKFTGHMYDSDTGLTYMNARYYPGATGRFLSQDPAVIVLNRDLSNPQTLNSYSYVLNNPLYFVDPTGTTEREFWSGFVQGGAQTAWDNVVQTVQAVAHPVQTLRQIGDSISYFGDQWKGFIGDVANDPNKVFTEAAQGYAITASEFSQLSDYEQGLRGGQIGLGFGAMVVSGGRSVVMTPKQVLGSWRNVNKNSITETIKYHHRVHGAGRTISEYTQDGNSFYSKYKDQGRPHLLNNGETGLKIRVKENNYYGIYDSDGKQVSHGPINDDRSFSVE
ncbi:MAG: FG-GAP-like repeat-containing protein [Patescibacteria group bacterium]